MFMLLFSFLMVLCVSLLPQVQAASDIAGPVENSVTSEPERNENEENGPEEDDAEPEDENTANDPVNVEAPTSIQQAVLVPSTAEPWPCKTKHWCHDNDGHGLEILVNFDPTIIRMDRMQNMLALDESKTVNREKLHRLAKTIEKQLEEIEEDKELNICMFQCAYCGGEWSDLPRLKDHVVGRKTKWFWRVECKERLSKDEIANPKRIWLTDFPMGEHCL